VLPLSGPISIQVAGRHCSRTKTSPSSRSATFATGSLHLTLETHKASWPG
jgi:hypothetical protein